VAQLCVAALDKGWAIAGEPRLDLSHACSPECINIYGLVSINNLFIGQAYGFLSETESEADGSTNEQSAYQAAAHYSRAHNGVSMVVLKDGQVVFQDYQTYYSAEDAHSIFS
jgi:hypothetical protein